MSMAALPKIAKFGINLTINGLDKNSLDLVLEKLQALRVACVRLDFDLKSRYTDGDYDYFLRKCQQNGIMVLGLLYRVVPGTVLNILYPERIYEPVLKIKEQYLGFVETTVRKYSRYISHWEIWNEPNFKRFWPGGPSPEEYNVLLSEAGALIKSISKSAQVVFGGIMSADFKKMIHGHRPHFFTDFVKRFGDNAFDFASFHPYTYDCYFSIKGLEKYKTALAENFHALQASVRNVTSKPLWLTEFGISPRWVRVAQRDIAKILAWYIDLCSKHNTNFFIWQLYDVKDAEYERLTPEKHFGLLDSNLHPKPLYTFLVDEIKNVRR